jgi:hypothetical protein
VAGEWRSTATKFGWLRLSGRLRWGLGVKTKLLAAISAGMVGLAGAGVATADTITFSQFGAMTDTPVTMWNGNAATPAGESIGTAESGGTLALPSGWTLAGAPTNGTQVVQGQYGYSAAPQFLLMKDAAPYLSLQANQSATLTAPGGGVSELQLYIGSLDSYNSLTFNFAGGGSETLGGDFLVNNHTGDNAIDNGDQQAGTSNGLWTFDFSSDVTSVVFGTGSTNAFEIANIGVPDGQIDGSPVPLGIPEPATWGLTLMGLFGAGSMLRAARRTPIAVG